ncbi:hypothetical protein BGZ65_009616 [Modicella reniformis]|uniref:Selenoprotein O n=1 Tax=Modicella reniformis TaxID=1440133 RepID=A0A9P6J6P1_9FUNG|nr:hypothetical protein BGZ65_009616 [Modicella reniformis]
MSTCDISSASASSSSPPLPIATPIPPPLPHPRYPSKFTSSLPCDEISALGHGDSKDKSPFPDSVLSTPRIVRNAVYSFVNPEDQSKEAFLLSWNKELAELIGVDKDKLERKKWTDEEYDNVLEVLTGGARKFATTEPTDGDKGARLAEPWALCYSGHQFGFYAGQLGDGRAISLYETVNPKTGEAWELQLKGAGKTPYSRFADGYAVLRSSIREYLSMAALEIPSSRSLAIMSTKTTVIREEGSEPGAIVCRVAPSWIRFGNFEIFFYRKDRKNLRNLADYVTHEVFNLPKDDPQEMVAFVEKFGSIRLQKPLDMSSKAEETSSSQPTTTAAAEGAAEGAPVAAPVTHRPAYRNRFAKMYEQIASRTAIMYDPKWICNHSDTEGRYAFQQQPGICLWNLARLGLTLENLIGAQERVDDLEWMKEQESDPEKEEYLKEAAQNIVIDILNESFREVFLKDYRQRMNAKLGLGGPEHVRKEDLTKILMPALSWMDDYGVDFHQFFRNLADYKVQDTQSVENNMEQVEAFVKKLLSSTIWQARGSAAIEESKTWLTVYHSRLVESEELKDDPKRRSRMNKVNPVFVLRNWVAQKVIERVTESVRKSREGSQEDDPDKDLLDRVLWMCQHPFGNDGEEVLADKEASPKKDYAGAAEVCEITRNDSGQEVYGEFVGPVPDWGQGIQCSCSS